LNIIHAIILGVVEGVTEFLPVSSTGHLILAAQLLKIFQSEFIKSFEIIIQLGAIFSVVVLYYRTLFFDGKVARRLLAAFIPTAAIGFIFHKPVKQFLLGNSSAVVWALLLGGLFLIVFELLHREKKDAADSVAAISYPQAVCIGFFQSIALFPGVSRSAATIIGGLFVGLKRRTIVEFSFMLAVPTMLAATVLDASKSMTHFSREQLIFLLAGFATSFLVALFAIKFLLSFVQKHNFIAFGIYRVAIAVVFLVYVLR
jgi:undecaprenyl-diphosphatase